MTIQKLVFITQRHDTDLQIDLQALVIDFCLKGDKMELLCDNQRGLEKADYSNLYCTNCMDCPWVLKFNFSLLQKLNQTNHPYI